MDNSTEGLRPVNMDELIEPDDVFFIDGKMQLVAPRMVGKTIYEASLLHFPTHSGDILSVFRAEVVVKVCDPDQLIKVHVNYSQK